MTATTTRVDGPDAPDGPAISHDDHRALRGDPRRWHDAIATIAACDRLMALLSSTATAT